MFGEEKINDLNDLKSKYQLYGQKGLSKDEWKRYSKLRFEEREEGRYERALKEAPQIRTETARKEREEKRREEWVKTIFGVVATFLFIYLLAYRIANESPRSVTLDECLSEARSEQEKSYCRNYSDREDDREQTYPW